MISITSPLLRLCNLLLSSLLLVHAQVPFNPEHVVLANCINNNGTQLSKMLYYSADITLIKDDSATVITPLNETAKWEGDTISAKFPTGVVFEATLQNPRVKLNHFAGPGTNAYVDFNCFYRPKPWWSNVDGISCYQLYDCTHESVVANGTAKTTRTLDDQRSENIIALGVGLGVGVPTLIVTVLGTWYAHRRHHREVVVA